MEINAENIEGLAHLSERFANPEIADHLHVYKVDKVLLECYDAFIGPFYIAKEISEDKVATFCKELGLKYDEDYGKG